MDWIGFLGLLVVEKKNRSITILNRLLTGSIHRHESIIPRRGRGWGWSNSCATIVRCMCVLSTYDIARVCRVPCAVCRGGGGDSGGFVPRRPELGLGMCGSSTAFTTREAHTVCDLAQPSQPVRTGGPRDRTGEGGCH